MATYKITGIKELDRKLKDLPAKVAKKVLRQALRKGLKPVAAAVKAAAPVESGATKSAVKIKAGKRSTKRITISVTIGAGDYKGDQFYAAFQEFGWSQNGVLHPGKHFMENAFKATSTTALSTTLAAVKSGLEKIA